MFVLVTVPLQYFHKFAAPRCLHFLIHSPIHILIYFKFSYGCPFSVTPSSAFRFRSVICSPPLSLFFSNWFIVREPGRELLGVLISRQTGPHRAADRPSFDQLNSRAHDCHVVVVSFLVPRSYIIVILVSWRSQLTIRQPIS